jgi:hypothetical protein
MRATGAGNMTGYGSFVDENYLGRLIKLSDALMNAQVAVYPIDAGGVGRISRVNAISSMRHMAERTGGKTFAGQNNLVASLRESMDDGSTYYTLTYYPDNKNWNGQFRHIEVKTTHPSVQLRFRLGYYALDPALDSPTKTDTKKPAIALAQALALDVPDATAILFRADVVPPASKQQKVLVNFHIDPRTLRFEETSDGVEHASVSCALVAFSPKGSPVKEELNNTTSKVQPSEFPKLMRASFPCQVTAELNSGKYTLRLGVVDRSSQLLGTTTATLTVP